MNAFRTRPRSITEKPPLFLLLLLLFLPGCLRPTRKPVSTVHFPPPRDGGQPRPLLVLLPGRGDRVESFTRRKTIRVFQHAFPRADCIAVDLHLAYYRNRTFLERLRNDVILPARESGFDPVWLMGISMGGMGALFYLRDHPGEIDGVIVLAPFLGDDALIEEIERAGGPRAWSPPSPANADFQENLWRWLRRFSPDDPPPIFLAYGTGDRFHRAQRMLASLLPSTRTISIPGKHRWDTWTKLWKKIVPRFRDEWNRGA